ncbi:hypothetical protein PsAD2_00835 [Pseudovibrio axinellae]|uniref:Uncharacterized protein n=1 Tax=Pseudovibrio axinellae TaxID=989403 RepID=A0A166ATN3_9HYPH|nr:hypothetical protein [Pseudovibrio axinellae]KZL21537.1 hypothetical protein PsAD2_00835 [Pseudovibrio axinellae]SER08757.1 hypothetical protein SAMN05421798_106106 [Pseudovibrio axinellae]
MQWSSLFLYSAIAVMQPTGGERDNILPSWNEGKLRHGIIESIERMGRGGSPEYVKLDERVAVLVGDGALWSEVLAEADGKVATPKTPNDLSLLSVYTEDVRALLSLEGPQAVGARYREFAYQPLIELVGFLKERQFQIWVLSFGDHEVDRSMAKLNYGVPRNRVIEISNKPNANQPNDLAKAIWERIGSEPKVFLGRTHGDLGLLDLASQEEGTLKLQIVEEGSVVGVSPDATSGTQDQRSSSWNFVISPSVHWQRKFSWQPPSETTLTNNQ